VRNLRALVVDDSSLSRRTIAAILRDIPGVSHVDVASDGADALRIVEINPPDFITLDLEMPRLDGFEFLQLLMDRHPLPVLVVSRLGAKENVFRALELGAIDFLESPNGEQAHLDGLTTQLAEKVGVVRKLSPLAMKRTTHGGFALDAEPRGKLEERSDSLSFPRRPSKVIVIGASTGGPQALVTLFRHLTEEIDAAIVVAQHMPPRFTRTFAARLDRTGPLRVAEAKSFERLARGHGYVCPGGYCSEVVSTERGPAVRVVPPEEGSHYVPSVDRLFVSAARTLGSAAIAVVLTGMGNDGAEGVREIAKHGGSVLIEAPGTAVVSGMPLAARETGVEHHSLGIWDLSGMVAKLAKPARGGPEL
jgi:two-component system chemotaxis response regulator CheB